jgi:hypothetical protein
VILGLISVAATDAVPFWSERIVRVRGQLALPAGPPG